MKILRALSILIATTFALAVATASADGPSQIDRYVTGSSESVSLGGGRYTLVSTIGYPGEAMPSTGGEYALFGGFWSTGQGNTPPLALVPGLTAAGLWLLAAVLAVVVVRTARSARAT